MHRLRLTLVALVPLALVAAGCGGGGGTSPGVASVASSTTTPTGSGTQPSQSSLVSFSQCMRSHGVANFPDPQRYADGNVKLTIHNYGTPGPKFNAALNVCNHLLPTGPNENAPQSPAKLAAELSFARCMRSKGLAQFPDPTAEGGLPVEAVIAAGIDIHSQLVLRDVQACLPASHGWLTAAKVREALANH